MEGRVLGVPEGRVVVERDLAVQGQDGAVRGEREGVDLHEGGVLGGDDLPQAHDDLGDPGGRGAGLEARRPDDLRGDVVGEAGQGIDGDPCERLRALGGEGLDVHAALARAHGQVAPLRPVQEDGEVELGVDIGALGDEDGAHHVPLDVHAQDVAGAVLGLLGGAGEPDAAGLATAAGLDLGLDDDQGRAGPEQLRGGLSRALGSRGDRAVEHRHAVRSEQVSRLVLVQIHPVHPSGPAHRGSAVDPRAPHVRARRQG